MEFPRLLYSSALFRVPYLNNLSRFGRIITLIKWWGYKIKLKYSVISCVVSIRPIEYAAQFHSKHTTESTNIHIVVVVLR
jgi:hypothetical protein